MLVYSDDALPDWPDTPNLPCDFVDDAAATLERAVAAGTRIVTALEDSAWGDRVGRLRYPLGNIWRVMQHVEVVAPDEVAARMHVPRYAEAMRQAQASLDAERSGRAQGWASPPVL